MNASSDRCDSEHQKQEDKKKKTPKPLNNTNVSISDAIEDSKDINRFKACIALYVIMLTNMRRQTLRM